VTQRYAKYYKRYSPLAPFVFARDGVLAGSQLRRLSLLNRMKDYLRLRHESARLALHCELNAHLVRQASGWNSYDYGEGYFYQGFARLGITGLRDTDARVAAMALPDRLRDRTVLEIGSNAGFLACNLAGTARHVTGIELNPYLVDIGRSTIAHLGLNNVTLVGGAWETFAPDQRYDVVLSFANHATYDRNTRQTVEEYFDRCARMLMPGGLLLFESHPPAHEGDGLDAVCQAIANRFDLLERHVFDYGTFLDRGRTFVAARKRNLS
jgi:cyclopropane fatty-acyl-phospholipid synthase-like methyltransferase